MSKELDVPVPDIGDFTDVPVIEIHVAAGEEVAIEDPLVTLESDKATMDVPAPFAGVVRQLRVAIGDRVSEGSVLLTLEAAEDPALEAGSAAPGDAAQPGSGPGKPRGGAEIPPPPAASVPPPRADVVGASTGASVPEPGAATIPSPTRADVPLPPREPRPASSPPSRESGGGKQWDAQLVVIGSGPGGYSAAFRGADLGLRTILIERYETLGGVCLNVGCIPSKALLHAARVISEADEMAAHGIAFGSPRIDVEKLLSWKQSVVSKLTAGLRTLARQRKVEVVTGVAHFGGPNAVVVGERTISFENCIIAAGSTAARLPDLPDDARVIDSTSALSPASVPKRLLVIGGGIIGLEMATIYDALGASVTVVELLDQLIPGCDPDLVRPLAHRIGERYESVLVGTKLQSLEAQKRGLKATFSSGESSVFDQVLVAVGRRPNGGELGADAAGVTVDDAGFIPVDRQMRTNVPWIYAIGDIVGGPMLAHKASHEGKVAAEVIAGVPGAAFDARSIPSVAYTDPEVAWTGLTETAARADGIEYEKAVIPWAASGRAHSLARPEGMTKLLLDPGTRRLLGAGLVGVGAGELIAELVHAIEMGSDAEDLALTIHPHPTLTETVMFAAEMAEGTITDLMPKR